jgi:hypothetical protein
MHNLKRSPLGIALKLTGTYEISIKNRQKVTTIRNVQMTRHVYLTDMLTKLGLLLVEESLSFVPYYASEPPDSGRSNDHESHSIYQLELLVAPQFVVGLPSSSRKISFR